MVAGYTAKEVAGLLGLSVGQVRGFVKQGVLTPSVLDGDLSFSFQDVVLLRAAKGLRGARIASSRIKRALQKLRVQLPPGRPLTAVAIAADGKRIVVRDGGTRWNPESGQALFDFNVAELLAKVAPLRDSRSQRPEDDAIVWYEQACALEERDVGAAIAAYTRAIELDPEHCNAHINVGRLLHESNRLRDALAHYRLALAIRPQDAIASFNLGVALEDLGRTNDAIDAYHTTLRSDRRHADAHHNLARLYDRLGRNKSATRHYQVYEALTD